MIRNIAITCNHERKDHSLYTTDYKGKLISPSKIRVKNVESNASLTLDPDKIDHIRYVFIDINIEYDTSAEIKDINDTLFDTGSVDINIYLKGVRKTKDLSYKRDVKDEER